MVDTAFSNAGERHFQLKHLMLVDLLFALRSRADLQAKFGGGRQSREQSVK